MRTWTFASILAMAAIFPANPSYVLAHSAVRPEAAQISAATYWPTKGWRASAPEAEGFDSAKLAAGLLALQKQGTHINSLLIVRNGHLILDAYFDPYTGSFPHKLASVTKSVTASVLGIAIDRGKLRLDQPMVSFFPDRNIANLDGRKQTVTVQNLAEMKNGMDSGCLAEDEHTLDVMRSNPDWVQAALDRKMVGDPGTRFCYDSPGMHLLSTIVQKATGVTQFEYARQNLFEPLGIQNVMWQRDPQGHTRGWGDLYLHPRDAAKIGYLWLHDGRWDDKQIISARWLADMLKPHGNAGDDDYGYGIWVARATPPNDSYFAVGGGGQYIRVYPSYEVIVVVTAQGLHDYDELEPLLRSSFISPDNPLPANPVALAGLNATLTKLIQASHPWPARPLPATVKAISSKTYAFESNAIALATLRLDSNEAAEAKLHMNIEGADVIWPIGLDGEYRMASSGQTLRGYWKDSETFVFQIFEDDISTFRLHFVDDRLEVSSPERGLSFKGLIKKP